MGRQEDRGAAALDATDQLPEVAARLRVEPGGRLVEKQDLRLIHECCRYREPLALATRELRLLLTRALLQVDLTQERQLVDLELVAGGEEPHGLARGQVVGERARLQLDADPALHTGWIGEHVDPSHGGRSTVRFSEPFQDLDSRRLPRSVRTEETEDLARFDEEADPADRFDLAVALPQVTDLHDRRHGLDASGSRRRRRTRDR